MGLGVPIAILLVPLVGVTGTGARVTRFPGSDGASLHHLAGVGDRVLYLSASATPSISTSMATSSAQSAAPTSNSPPAASLERLAEFRVSAVPTCRGLLAAAERERASRV